MFIFTDLILYKVELKYPIILVHGIGAKDSGLFWGRIPKKLENLGLKVFLEILTLGVALKITQTS